MSSQTFSSSVGTAPSSTNTFVSNSGAIANGGVMLPSLLVICNPYGGGGKAAGTIDKLKESLDRLYSPATGYATALSIRATSHTSNRIGGSDQASNNSFAGGGSSSENLTTSGPLVGPGGAVGTSQVVAPNTSTGAEREEIQRNRAAVARHHHRTQLLRQSSTLHQQENSTGGGNNSGTANHTTGGSAPKGGDDSNSHSFTIPPSSSALSHSGPSVPLTSLRPDAAMATASPGTYCFERTLAPNDAIRLAICGASLQFDIVLAVGGDGTLSEVINGIARGVCTLDCIEGNYMNRRQLLGLCGSVSADAAPTVLYLVAGTGGDFSRSGACCRTIDQVIEQLEGWAQWHHHQVQTAQEQSSDGTGASSSTAMSSSSRASNRRLEQPMRRIERPPKKQRIDVAFARFLRTRTIRFFVNVCSAGLGYEVCNRAEKLKKPLSCLGGKAVFWAASFVELLAMSHRNISIRPWYADGSPAEVPKDNVSNPSSPKVRTGARRPHETSEDDGDKSTLIENSAVNNDVTPVKGGVVSDGWYHTKVTAAVFCNGRFFGGGMKVSPEASTQDQLLNLTLWRERFLGFLCGMMSVYNGNHTYWKSTSQMQATLYEVKATADGDNGKIGFECDGELAGTLPAAVGIAGSVNFLVPPESGVQKAASLKLPWFSGGKSNSSASSGPHADRSSQYV